MKGNTIVSAGQAWGPSPSLVSRKPAGEGWKDRNRGVRLGEGCHSPSSSLRWVTREIGGRKSDRCGKVGGRKSWGYRLVHLVPEGPQQATTRPGLEVGEQLTSPTCNP